MVIESQTHTAGYYDAREYSRELLDKKMYDSIQRELRDGGKFVTHKQIKKWLVRIQRNLPEFRFEDIVKTAAESCKSSKGLFKQGTLYRDIAQHSDVIRAKLIAKRLLGSAKKPLTKEFYNV